MERLGAGAHARHVVLLDFTDNGAPSRGSPQQPTGPANRVFGLLPPVLAATYGPSHGGTFAYLDEVLRRMPPRSPRRMLAAMSQDLPMIVAPAVPPASARR